MPADPNKTLIRDYVDQINARNLEKALAYLSPEYVDHALPLGMNTGIEGTRQSFLLQFSAFPDLRAAIDDLIAEGDQVVSRLTLSGTNTGVFIGLPPTGKPATWSRIDIYRIADGLLAEHWSEVDTFALMRDLGIAPPLA